MHMIPSSVSEIELVVTAQICENPLSSSWDGGSSHAHCKP